MSRLPRTRRPSRTLGLSLAAAGVAFSTGVGRAQLVSDEVPQERTIPPKEQIDRDLQRSRLSLGPIRLIPSIALINAGYDSNAFGSAEDQVGDWTFTIRGGLRFILPLGRKMYFRADALPQYTWYDKVSERRSFGGVANASLFGFFNHMTLQLTGYGSKDFGLYSTEFLSRVRSRTVGGLGAAEIQLTGPISLFGKGEVQRVRYDTVGQLPVFDVTINNRTDTEARGGIRYRVNPEWSVSTAYEQTWSDFDRDPEARNNLSRAYLVGFQYNRPRFYVNLSGGYREGRPRDASTFLPYSTGTGSFFASFAVSRLLELQAYGRRVVTYSITTTDPYYFENQFGGGVNIQPLSRVQLRGYAQAGPLEYPDTVLVDGNPVKRRDQRRLYGGGLSVTLSNQAILTGLVTRITTSSNVASSTVTSGTRYTVNVSLYGELTR